MEKLKNLRGKLTSLPKALILASVLVVVGAAVAVCFERVVLMVLLYHLGNGMSCTGVECNKVCSVV